MKPETTLSAPADPIAKIALRLIDQGGQIHFPPNNGNIVPPSWRQPESFAELRSAWRQATANLSRANKKLPTESFDEIFARTHSVAYVANALITTDNKVVGLCTSGSVGAIRIGGVWRISPEHFEEFRDVLRSKVR